MRTVILCGGKGTRAYPHTTQVPKPLLEVAGRPVLQHVMESYAAQGFTSFVLAAGFKIELIDEFARTLPSGWDVDVVDTGVETNTGGRIAQCRDRMGDTFFATYSDGLSDIDLRALQEFHEGHDGTATLSTVPLPSQYGTIVFGEDRRVSLFREKPVLGDHWINGGFFVFEPAVLDYLSGDATILERDPLERLAADGQLMAYKHTGFWQPMDTLREKEILESLWASGTAPWKLWT